MEFGIIPVMFVFVILRKLVFRSETMKQTFRRISMKYVLNHVAPQSSVRLRAGMFRNRFELNRSYVMSLENHSLLQNHLLEAGLTQFRLGETKRNRNYDTLQLDDGSSGIHWGWESPTCQLRGHFLGHWLSSAARIYASTHDAEAKAKADAIVAELARCQVANGGEWVGSIPPDYLYRIARGQNIWAPHYTIHKTLMGLVHMHRYADSTQALEILVKTAEWFRRWTAGFSREEFDEILDVETGGMLEVWADLYGITGEKNHLELVERYTRARLFQPLLDGNDVLTNRHSNTTIPEIHGAARAYEVTGDERWRRIVEAYWKSAVTDRGYFCTGGQSSGEIWTPPFHLSARLGDTNQEHCVVYNMILLADFLYRWTGDVRYADYIERNTYNGILAQQNPHTGMIAYFLPLEAGARKVWASKTNDFWCCHGSLVQAHTTHNAYVYYQNDDGLTISQYIPTDLTWEHGGTTVRVSQDSANAKDRNDIKRTYVSDSERWHRPNEWRMLINVEADRPVEFSLGLRIPSWLSGKATIRLDGKEIASVDASTLKSLKQVWHHNKLEVVFPKRLRTEPLPDEPGTYAVLDGPVVLAGICDGERRIEGDPEHPETFLTPDNEREWWDWLPAYRTVGQSAGMRFIPLLDVDDESYTTYFPISTGSGTAK